MQGQKNAVILEWSTDLTYCETAHQGGGRTTARSLIAGAQGFLLSVVVGGAGGGRGIRRKVGRRGEHISVGSSPSGGRGGG